MGNGENMRVCGHSSHYDTFFEEMNSNFIVSGLYPLHPGRCRSPAQPQRGAGYSLRVSRRAEGHV